MKRKLINVIIMTMFIMLMAGCGDKEEADKIDAIAESKVSETSETENIIPTDSKTVEPESEASATDDIDGKITEKEDSELDLKAYYFTFEDKTVCDGGEDVFGSVNFEYTDSYSYVTTGKVPIYAQNGVKLGYTKEDVDIIVIGICDDWVYFYLNDGKYYARLSDIEANSITIAERDEMNAKIEEEAKAKAESEMAANNSEAQSTAPVVQEAVPNDTVTEPVETPVTSDKYTPDEAISVYRSLMEAGGMTWDPSLKNGGSWGTGWIYLDKGMPEWTAETNLESAAIGNHGGDSWTQYYLEVTGSDDECVYITEWHD